MAGKPLWREPRKYDPAGRGDIATAVRLSCGHDAVGEPITTSPARRWWCEPCRSFRRARS